MLSTRKALLKKTMDLANEVSGLLNIFGVCLPKAVKHGSFDGVVCPMIEIDDILANALCLRLMRGLCYINIIWSWIGGSNERPVMTRSVNRTNDELSRTPIYPALSSPTTC